MKNALYLFLKYLLMNFLALYSPPNNSKIELEKNFRVNTNITKPIIKTIKLKGILLNINIKGYVSMSTMLIRDIVSFVVIEFDTYKDRFENILKKYSKRNKIITKIML